MSILDVANDLITAGRIRDAVGTMEAAAAGGDPQSSLQLGLWYLEGQIIPRDLSKARDQFSHAGSIGSLIAEHIFICFMANGVGGSRDWAEAERRVRALANVDKWASKQLEVLEDMVLDDQGDPTRDFERRCINPHSPHLWAIADFATRQECQYLIDVAEPLLRQSQIVSPETGQMMPHPVRTSDGAMFPFVSEDLVITAFNRRIAAITSTVPGCGEPLQVLRYRHNQQYRPHVDALPAASNQRVLTVLTYLNDNYHGGETAFTRAGLAFRGELGEALIFRNTLESGAADQSAEHAGQPVTRGEKFIASRWIRAQPLSVC